MPDEDQAAINQDESVNVTTTSKTKASEIEKGEIVKIIQYSNTFLDVIAKLERQDLIWYFVGPLLQDKDIEKEVNAKWKNAFQGFNKQISAVCDKLQSSLNTQDFLVYPQDINNNNFEIRFEGENSEQKTIEISKILEKGKTYTVHLGENSQVTAKIDENDVKNYTFTGPKLCEMTLNWNVGDIECKITIKVNKDGIQEVGDRQFVSKELGKIEDRKKMLELIEQNKSVRINGKFLGQIITLGEQKVSDQQAAKTEVPTETSAVEQTTPSSHSSTVSSSHGPEPAHSSTISGSEGTVLSQTESSGVSNPERTTPKQTTQSKVSPNQSQKPSSHSSTPSQTY